MIITLYTLQMAFIMGTNKNGQLGVSGTYLYTSFELIQQSLAEYDLVALSDTAGYLAVSTQVNTTGNGFLFEKQQIPTPPFGQSDYLTQINPLQIGVSSEHTIALDSNHNIHTIGKNNYGQLARSTQDNFSTGQATSPQWQEDIIAVNAIQHLSVVVYRNAIFVAGQCTECLCGLDSNGREDQSKYTTWHKLNFEDIPNFVIKKVHFGPSQYIIETQDGNYYFLGKASYYNGCQTNQQHCTPQKLPFSDVRRIFLTEYSTAYLKTSDEIFYCGCPLQKNCTPTAQLTKYPIQETQIVDYYPLDRLMLMITSQGCYQYNQLGSSWIRRPCSFSQLTRVPTNFVGFGNAVIAYQQIRYLNIYVRGTGVVNLTIDNMSQQLLLPANISIPVAYSSIRYGETANIRAESSNCYTIEDTVTMRSSNTTVFYTMTQISSNNFQIIFDLYNILDGSPFIDIITINITSQQQNKQIYNGSTQSSNPIQFSAQNLLLYDVFIITIKTQTKLYAKKTIQYKVTSISSTINIYLQPMEQQIIQFMDSNFNVVSNIQITVLNLNGSVHNIAFTDANGEIGIPRLPTDSQQGGIDVIIYFPGDNQFQLFRQQIHLPFNNYTHTLILDFLNEFFYVEITHQSSGTVTFWYPNGTSFYNITFPLSVNNTTVYRDSVPIQQKWNITGLNITASFSDPQNLTYAVNITQQIQNGTSFSFTVLPKIRTVILTFINQTNSIVPNYQVQVTTDNNATITTYQTDSQGQIQFQVNTYDMYQQNQSILLWADETDVYAAINKTIINPNVQSLPYNINVYQYAIFQLTFHISDSIISTSLSGIILLLKDQTGAILFNETSDASGYVRISISEKRNIIILNQQYTIQIEDPSNQYDSYTNFIYTNTPNIIQNYILNAHRLKFLTYDIRNNQIAQGAQIQITIGQQKTFCQSDSAGILFVDIQGQFAINNLFYSVISTDIYKPQPIQTFQYQVGVMTLYVESWYNFSISVKIIDGKTNISLSGINASIYTNKGQLQYWQITDYSGLLQVNYSERNPIVTIGPVYNLSIVDTLGRYKNFNVNYSISSPTEHDILPLNIQQVTLIMANYNGERIGGIVANIYSNGQFLGQYKSNQLGVLNFYVRAIQFVNKQLTYTIEQSDNYRPKTSHQLKIQTNPQLHLVRVFPLVIFRFELNITLPNNETDIYVNISENSIQQTNNQRSSIKQFKNNLHLKQLNLLTSDNIYDNPYNQNLQLQFLTHSDEILFTTHINNIFSPIEYLFVENINETFEINSDYKMKIIDKTKRYHSVEANFTSFELETEFQIQLRRIEYKYRFPIYIYLGIGSALLMVSFLIYAVVKFSSFKKGFKKMHDELGLRYSRKEYHNQEQMYIDECVDELNSRYRNQIQTHEITRNKIKKQQKDDFKLYQYKVISASKIMLDQKIEDIEFTK